MSLSAAIARCPLSPKTVYRSQDAVSEGREAFEASKKRLAAFRAVSLRMDNYSKRVKIIIGA